jgi:hypothetical protein
MFKNELVAFQYLVAFTKMYCIRVIMRIKWNTKIPLFNKQQWLIKDQIIENKKDHDLCLIDNVYHYMYILDLGNDQKDYYSFCVNTVIVKFIN